MYVSQLLLAVAAASTAAAANMAPREPTPTTAAAHVAGRDLAECSSVAADFTSYASALLAWQEDHIGEFRSLWQACSDVPGIRDQVDLPTGSGSCASLAAKITGVAEPAATGTSGSDGSPAATDASASQSDNAAPRASGRALVGIAAGCLAAVGLMY
ncbi:hypothetical protein VdG1_04699 [Verticillium dahliae VDG1]|nr:hypothetical protein VdG1_04699 [Verticillium dahliae VDG1]